MDAYLQITKDCNHDCIFCSAPKEKLYLTYDEVILRIERFRKLGVGVNSANEFVVTGGEPTLHPDLIKIISYLNNNNLSFRMVSNGVKLSDKDFLKKLSAAGLKRTLISYHHFDLDEAFNISKAEYKDLPDTLRAISNLDELKMDMNINVTIIRQNYKILKELIATIIPKYKNIHHVNFNFVDITGNTLSSKFMDVREVAPKYSECEKYLYDVFNYLKNNDISFRFERSPLCYCRGFEEYSSDANRNVGSEYYMTTFTNKSENDITYNQSGFKKNEDCLLCSNNTICSGFSPHYEGIYGLGEIYPCFDNSNEIEFKIKNVSFFREKILFSKIEYHDYDSLEKPIVDAFKSLGGIIKFIKPNKKILIKPDFNLTDNSSKLISKQIIGTLIKLLKQNGNVIYIADISDCVFSDNKKLNNSFIKNICLEEKVNYLDLLSYGFQKKKVNNFFKLHTVEISKIVDEVDYIINLPKLKNDSITSISGAIKNIFDLISPNLKNQINNIRNKTDFSKCLIDIYSLLKSKIALTFMDGIEFVDTSEKSKNKKENFKTNFFLISRDALSADVVSSYLLNYKISDVPTNILAEKAKLGSTDMNRIDSFGVNLEEHIFFNLNFNNIFKENDTYKVIPKNKNCISCFSCINVCPTSAIYYKNSKINIDESKCISCYSCYDICTKKEFNLIKKDR